MKKVSKVIKEANNVELKKKGNSEEEETGWEKDKDTAGKDPDSRY